MIYRTHKNRALIEWRKKCAYLYPIEHGKTFPTFEVPMAKNPEKLTSKGWR